MIQFCHRHQGQKNKRTYAVDLPTKLHIFEAIQNLGQSCQTTLFIKVGIAKCNPVDQYSKKIGRAIAHSKLQTRHMHIQEVSIANDAYYVVVEDDSIYLYFKVFLNSDTLYLLGAGTYAH